MIPVAKPYITKTDQLAVMRILQSGWILQGPKVEELEKLSAALIHIPYAVATSSCTTAMHLGLLATGIRPGMEIIVPSFSFIASANCIMHAGAVPIFADIDPKTYNLDPLDVEKRITSKTRAILVVHQVGLPADMDKITKIAKKYKLLLLEDCACALGARIGTKHVGTWGTWGAFSFHPRKAITTAEGGLLVTKNASVAKKVSMLRAHGANMSVSSRHTSKRVTMEDYTLIGYNFRMSDIHAALGVSQFTRFNEIFRKRQVIAMRYTKAFSNVPTITTPFVPKGFIHSFQSYVIRVHTDETKRNRIMQYLLDHGIATRIGVMASHKTTIYKRLYPRLSLPHTELATVQTIALPIYEQLTVSEQNKVITHIGKAVQKLL